MWSKLAVLAVLATVKCTPVPEYGAAENFVSAVSECIEKDTSVCLKEKALKLTERLAYSKNIDIFEGMSLVNLGSSRSARSYEPLAEDLKTRESQLEERIADNFGDFLGNHVLQLRLTDNSDESRGMDEEGRGKKKKQIKKLLPLLLLLKLKMAALIPLFLGIIAFVAVKAVFLGKIMFAMNAVNLIRKLLSKGGSSGGASGHSSSHHEEHPGYSYEPAQSSGWSKRANDASSIAYAAQIQQ
ncbi:hypothetical protein JYU34_019209 [Plutella xylostella]|uniref:Uncharacterized protein n=2 Tax=Plutella xylostella TaxID=51655 RepID=A0ABQ7Q030_PLUXY|nr:hypothetical protein JYU34_019209 [Plutella xylostella]CAG9135581.1 unnamed protein product [Plutella xylostella]